MRQPESDQQANSNLLVLEVRKLNENLGSGVLNFKELENGGTVVGHRHILVG